MKNKALYIIPIVLILTILYLVKEFNTGLSERIDASPGNVKPENNLENIDFDSTNVNIIDGHIEKEESSLKVKDAQELNEFTKKSSNSKSINSYHLPIYMLVNRYTDEYRRQLEENSVQPFILLTSSTIDPEDNNSINKKSINSFIMRAIPDSLTRALLIIDWEKDLYDYLKLPESNPKFKEAERAYIELIKYVLKLRPNLKIGVYGLPFRVYEKKIRDINGNNFKFSKILKHTHFITPSFYFMHVDAEKGEETNDLILKNNLEVAFEYGDKINKPIMPFIWEIVHPNNKKFGGTIVPKNEFNRAIKNMERFRYNNRKINGFIWWTPHKLPSVYNSLGTNEQRNGVLKADALIKENHGKTTLEYFRSAFKTH
jgi:hypothetical protein